MYIVKYYSTIDIHTIYVTLRFVYWLALYPEAVPHTKFLNKIK
jgi:hypothetical protein